MTYWNVIYERSVKGQKNCECEIENAKRRIAILNVLDMLNVSNMPLVVFQSHNHDQITMAKLLNDTKKRKIKDYIVTLRNDIRRKLLHFGWESWVSAYCGEMVHFRFFIAWMASNLIWNQVNRDSVFSFSFTLLFHYVLCCYRCFFFSFVIF